MEHKELSLLNANTNFVETHIRDQGTNPIFQNRDLPCSRFKMPCELPSRRPQSKCTPRSSLQNSYYMERDVLSLCKTCDVLDRVEPLVLLAGRFITAEVAAPMPHRTTTANGSNQWLSWSSLTNGLQHLFPMPILRRRSRRQDRSRARPMKIFEEASQICLRARKTSYSSCECEAQRRVFQ